MSTGQGEDWEEKIVRKSGRWNKHVGNETVTHQLNVGEDYEKSSRIVCKWIETAQYESNVERKRSVLWINRFNQKLEWVWHTIVVELGLLKLK